MRAPKYPAPLYDTIIEPFAGAAGYSVRHYSHKVILVDASESICGIWDFLIHASVAEIRALPLLEPGADVRDLAIPQEAKWLLGYWCAPGAATPRWHVVRASHRLKSGTWNEHIRDRLAAQVDSIRHWRVVHGDYTGCPDTEATWFVDPPYVDQGKHYRNRITDYGALAAWCQTRPGQTMVCESLGATWLPFEPVTTVDGASHRKTTEVLWQRHSAAVTAG